MSTPHKYKYVAHFVQAKFLGKMKAQISLFFLTSTVMAEFDIRPGTTAKGFCQIYLKFLTNYSAKLAYVYKRSLNFDPDWFVDPGDSSKTYEVDNLPSENGPLLTWILDYFKTPSIGLPSYESRQSTPHD